MLSSALTELSHRYVRLEELGEGTFGSVARVWDRKLLTTRALKSFKPDDEDVSECALREVAFQAFLTDVRAPNILPYIDVLLSTGPEVSMLQPLMSFDLADAIDDGRYEEWGEALSVIRGILEALRFLHGMQPAILHRDIKPENVLIEPTGRTLLTDLGFMRFTKDGPPYHSGALCYGSNQRSTRTYTAPEMLRHGVPHGPSVDIWASGVIGVELYKKNRLSACTDRTARRQLHTFCEKNSQDATLQFLRGMLEVDPRLRWTAAAVLLNPVFNAASLTEDADLAAPAPVRLTAPETLCIPEATSVNIGELMTELDFTCCQTFYAACAYATDAMQWHAGVPPGLAEVCLYSVLTAAKLYEHEYWEPAALAEKLEIADALGLTHDFVRFQKLLLQNRGGRLLVPFPETCTEFTKRVPPKPKKARHRRRGRYPVQRDEVSTESRPDEAAPSVDTEPVVFTSSAEVSV
jgi:hypothetical protein